MARDDVRQCGCVVRVHEGQPRGERVYEWARVCAEHTGWPKAAADRAPRAQDDHVVNLLAAVCPTEGEHAAFRSNFNDGNVDSITHWRRYEMTVLALRRAVAVLRHR